MFQNQKGDLSSFLHELYPVNLDGCYLTLWTDKARTSEHLKLLGNAIPWLYLNTWLNRLSEGENFFFCVGLRGTNLGSNQRGGEEDVVAIPGFWFDLDVQGQNHAESRLPIDFNEAQEFLDQLPWQPSILVNSGRGIHAYWLFKELWRFDFDDERQAAKALSKKFQQFIIKQGEQEGWKLDDTSDLARMLRVPGSKNWKDPNHPVEVEILKLDPSRRYLPSDFEDFVGMVDVDEATTRTELPQPKQIEKIIPEGSRNNSLASMAGKLRRADMNQQEIEAALLEANRQRCLPPLPEDEVRKIARSIAQYPNTANWTESFDLTDLGNARRLVQLYGKEIRYNREKKQWYVWNGKRWQVDSLGVVEQRGRDTILCMENELRQILDVKARDEYRKHIQRTKQGSKFDAMIKLASHEKGILFTLDKFDTDPYLLNCQNGTINLDTGEFLAHKPERMLSKIAPVVINENARCPLWLRFLDQIMAGNQDMIEYLQKIIGYSLTGDSSEQCFFILHGSGANGKSVFLETIRALLGDYARQANPTAFLERKQEMIRNDLARLEGSRFVTISETNQARKLDEAIIKLVTGNESMVARYLYGEEKEIESQYKVFLATNHKPNIEGLDLAIWRRIKVIPFIVTIPNNRQDKKLQLKLREELSGILNWAIQGCVKWRKDGLIEPEMVTLAIDNYKSEVDPLNSFIQDCCIIESNKKTTKSDLYHIYDKWCSESSEEPLDKNSFGAKIKARGISDTKSGNVRYWHGIGLK